MPPEGPLEIGTELEPVDIPIAAFPPFKLRSSMVDTDPVIWVHLIEVFIQYTQVILSLRAPLTDRSEQQLCLFVKSYLHEISEEQGQLLSLGLINVQITENLETLRCWMFELFKALGVMTLKLNGESLWDFARIYALKNANTVRSLIVGTLKPQKARSSTVVSSVSQVQKHIEHKITNGKFDKYDLSIFAGLMMESNTDSKLRSRENNKKNEEKMVRKNNRSGKKQDSFSDTFATVSWIEMLEKLYANGAGRFAPLCKDLAILTLLSTSTSRLVALATELGVNSTHTMTLFPLFCGIITSPQFRKSNMVIEQRLPFLKPRTKLQVNDDDVQTLVDMFPHLTITHTEHLLRKYHNNVEKVTMLLIENPEAGVEPEHTNKWSRHVNSVVPTADSIISKKVINKGRKNLNHVPDEAKNKTLTAALRLLYESDEDEHDDTYDEAEATTGGDQSKYDKIEKYLWEIFKKDPQSFEKTGRKSRKRNEMKDETKWTDEQIEGWARMIQKSPKRAKILEEKYMFRGNRPERSSYKRSEDEEIEEERGSRRSTPSSRSETPKSAGQSSQSKPALSKIQQSRNEKNKSSRANHNRKAGHDKKLAKGM